MVNIDKLDFSGQIRGTVIVELRRWGMRTVLKRVITIRYE